MQNPQQPAAPGTASDAYSQMPVKVMPDGSTNPNYSHPPVQGTATANTLNNNNSLNIHPHLLVLNQDTLHSNNNTNSHLLVLSQVTLHSNNKHMVNNHNNHNLVTVPSHQEPIQASQCPVKLIPVLNQCPAKLIPVLSQCPVKLTLVLSQCPAKLIPVLNQCPAKPTPVLSQCPVKCQAILNNQECNQECNPQ
eukprot:gene16729-19883_t